jgi:hypothetical protein
VLLALEDKCLGMLLHQRGVLFCLKPLQSVCLRWPCPKPPPPVSLSSLPDGQGAGTIHYSSLSMLFLRVSKPRRCCCSRLPSFSIGLKIKICRSLFLWLQRLYLFHYRVIEEAKVLTHLLIV